MRMLMYKVKMTAFGKVIIMKQTIPIELNVAYRSTYTNTTLTLIVRIVHTFF